MRLANADVPKVTVVIGEAYGSAYVTMNSKSIGADIVYAWPDAKIRHDGCSGSSEDHVCRGDQRF